MDASTHRITQTAIPSEIVSLRSWKNRLFCLILAGHAVRTTVFCVPSDSGRRITGTQMPNNFSRLSTCWKMGNGIAKQVTDTHSRSPCLVNIIFIRKLEIVLLSTFWNMAIPTGDLKAKFRQNFWNAAINRAIARSILQGPGHRWFFFTKVTEDTSGVSNSDDL